MGPLEILAAITTVANAAGSVKSLFGEKGGGSVGGAASAQTQGGSDIPFTPVGLETLNISPFDYMEMQRQFEQEESDVEEMQYGGPLYLDMGGGIGDLCDPEILADFDPSVVGSEVLSYSETGQPNTQASAPEASTVPPSGEVAADLEKQNRRDMIFQTLKDIPEFAKAIAKLKESPQKISVRGRGNIVPGAKGGRAYRQERQKTASQGITPFQYREMQGGGALNRQMFAQNYMPNGGDIRGPGGPKDDLIPVMASNGEYMLSKAAVDQAGRGNHARGIANLEQFNNRGNRRYG